MGIFEFVQMHWVEWLFAITTAILGAGYRNISIRLKEEQKKNKAIADGEKTL